MPASSAEDTSPSIAETAISWVVMIGDLAVKVPKPVRTDVLDQSTLATRAATCEQEVKMNRRLAPDVYLGAGEMVVDGESLEHAVVMRRMPAESSLAERIDADDAGDCLRAVVRAMAQFYDRSEPVDPVLATSVSSSDGLASRWSEDLGALRDLLPGTIDEDRLDEIAGSAYGYIAGRDELFEERIRDGMIVDGHGDLLADDIFCLADGPRILDCLAFDHTLRVGDVIADLAFLAMDLEHRGRRDLADEVFDTYGEVTGRPHPRSLADLYVAQRAVVRAKVAAGRVQQGDETFIGEIESLLALAAQHLQRAQAHLVLIGGPPGTGKSTVAEAVADDHGWLVVRSDEVRRDLGLRADDAGGGYGPESKERVYDETLNRAAIALRAGESVVVDATFSAPAHRIRGRALSRSCRARLVEIRCEASPALAAARLGKRRSGEAFASEATPELARSLAAEFEAWPEARTISTAGSVDAAVAHAHDALTDTGHGGDDESGDGEDNLEESSELGQEEGPGPDPGRPWPDAGPAEDTPPT